MSETKRTGNINSGLIIFLGGILVWYGQRLQTSVDNTSTFVTAHEIRLIQHDKDILKLQEDDDSSIKRPEYNNFKQIVEQRIGFVSVAKITTNMTKGN